ncbi:MAG TPA: hypothetical protein VK249_20240 [Anaerolineales bacterium]|nr:hypothetical protein [Anaerolineales bacterium]
MVQKQVALPIFLTTLILASLACTVFVGGPDYSSLPPIPISAQSADSIKDEVKRAFEAGAQTGVVTINLTEPQITSYLAARLQSDPSLQQSNKKPFITDPQVYLRDGQMQIYGKTQEGLFTANIGVIANMGVDASGQPQIEIASADFGPFPAPKGLKEAITAMVKEAYTGSFGPVATGLRIESIAIANGVMTITGRIK